VTIACEEFYDILIGGLDSVEILCKQLSSIGCFSR